MDDYDDYYDAAKKDGERFIQGKNGGCIDRGERQPPHTPGPWACVSGADKGAFTVYLPSDGMVICSRNQYESKHAEFLANARLIAAAPDLLALCVRFEAWLSETEAGQRARAERTFDSQGLVDLRAVIAKATGAA